MNNKVKYGKTKLKKVRRRYVKIRKTRRKPKNEKQKCTKKKQRYYVNSLSNHNYSDFDFSAE